MNASLPDYYFAEPHVEYGVEIDIAAMEKPDLVWHEAPDTVTTQGRRAAVEAALSWIPPAPLQNVPLTFLTDIVEIRIFNEMGGPVLAAAIELVSPANKDRPAHRDAFISKCKSYLQVGIGLMVIDVVTERHANLHDDLLRGLGVSNAIRLDTMLYASSYHPIEREGQPTMDLWQEPLRIGEALPTMPLWLKGGLCMPVDLDSSYEKTCQVLRIDSMTK